MLVAAVGALCEPPLPDIKGIDTFAGEIFHSARWNHDADLTGKRVAVIGTGASAIQIVPAIADEVGHLDVYQRTAPWVMPRHDRALPERGEAARTEHVPGCSGCARGDLLGPRVLCSASRSSRRSCSAAQRWPSATSTRRSTTPSCARAVTPD